MTNCSYTIGKRCLTGHRFKQPIKHELFRTTCPCSSPRCNLFIRSICVSKQCLQGSAYSISGYRKRHNKHDFWSYFPGPTLRSSLIVDASGSYHFTGRHNALGYAGRVRTTLRRYNKHYIKCKFLVYYLLCFDDRSVPLI